MSPTPPAAPTPAPPAAPTPAPPAAPTPATPAAPTPATPAAPTPPAAPPFAPTPAPPAAAPAAPGLPAARAVPSAPASSAARARSLPGWPLYDRLCLACHGTAGDGRGPAAPYLSPAPRALTRGELKWRSTPIGQPATDEDLRATIALGAPGTAMPGFPALDRAALDDVIAVVKAFAPEAWRSRARPIALAPPREPPSDPARGAALWRDKGCAACHGSGDGHGPSAVALHPPPYDLTTGPITGLHRPRLPGAEALRSAAALSIATGMAGTAMPGYAGAVSDAELWALADHVVALAGDRSPAGHGDPRPRLLTAEAIDADRAAPLVLGTWPGMGDPDERAVFGQPVAPQGAPPASLAPAQASLAARRCARCHRAQYDAWQGSRHRAGTSPGVVAQTEYGMAPPERALCLRCHGPLAEQARDPQLIGEGVSCAGCHVRGWVRHGPPRVTPSLLALPGYPLATLGLYERADFCLPCHQLPPRTALAGRPLLDTYKEWLDGPYLPRGVQCQHCHMPNRDHAVLGVHDPKTFRQAIALDARAHRRAGEVTVVATLSNVGAGHYLPTTPTPAAWLSIALIDRSGQAITGATERYRIGRDIYFDGAWHERADTRIPPGEAVRVARAWAAGRTGEATAARIAIEVHPDDFYERFYADQLAGDLAPAQRALFRQALDRALASHYVAEQRDVAIGP
jgi:mono/diheme cytochrome c family protein